MNITIKTVPHNDQRYETCGDWQYKENGDLEITVSELGDWRYEALVGIHEAVEALLCKHRGIKEEDVTAFDVEYEKKRPLGDTSEPGHDIDAPYRSEHLFATGLEYALASALGVCLSLYDQAVESLQKDSDLHDGTRSE